MTDQEMRTCPGCGRQIPTAYNVCPHCGRPAYGNQQYGPQPFYGPQPYGQQQYPPQYQEPLGALKYILYLLSFFSIIIGIIIFFLWDHDPNPEKRMVGKNCLLISLVSFILGVVAVVFIIIFGVGLIFL